MYINNVDGGGPREYEEEKPSRHSSAGWWAYIEILGRKQTARGTPRCDPLRNQ